MKKLILIDGHSLFFRAYYATAYSRSGLMQNKDGLYTNALFAFVNMIEKILEEDYSHILVTFDTSAPTRRHEAYPEYKAGRDKMPEEMSVQTPLIHEYLKHKNIKVLAKDGYEADDIIGTYSLIAGKDMKVDIYSSDRDLLQLINDNVTVKLMKKGLTEVVDMTPEVFYEEYGIHHKYIVDLKALMGDPSDNIPGIPGVGEKTGIKLIQEYGSIENIFANKEKVKGKLGERLVDGEKEAKISYELSIIDVDVPVDYSLAEIEKQAEDEKALVDFYRRMDLHTFIQRKEVQVKKEIEEDYNLFSYFEEVKEEESKERKTVVIQKESELTSLIEDNLAIYCEFYDVNYHNSEILGVGITNSTNNYFVSLDLVLKTNEFLDFLKSDRPKITYDYKAFKVALMWLGHDLNGVVYDMLLASYLINANINIKDMKYVAGEFGYDDLYYDDVIYGRGAKKKVPEEHVLVEHITKKTQAIYKLKEIIAKRLEKDSLVDLNKLEIDVSTVLAKMEYHGVKIDKDILAEQKSLLEKEILELEKEIHNYAGREFNIKSPIQLGEVLFDELNLQPSKKTATKRYSTNIEVLEGLIDDHPIIKPIIEYRSVTKLFSTYLEGIENALFTDSKLHTIYTQALTATGRLSSLEPNLQNIPVRTEEGRKIRKFFVSKDDHVFISADYSQIELRVLAHMSDSKTLIDDFNHGLDIHSQTAKKVFQTENVTPLERFKAKAVNFGIIYGISPFGLSKDINTSVGEAKDFIDRYFEIYPEIKKYLDKTVAEAIKKKYVTTIMNRRRYIPELSSSIGHVKAFGKRTAMNAPIQGSAADIIKKAMVDLDNYLEKNNLKSAIILQVHDELILEVPNNEVEIIKKVLPEIMSKTVSLKVKLETHVSVGKSWYELD